jgi:hypothetical protein
MTGRTPDWSELATENERVLTDGGASAERLVPASLGQASAEHVPGAPAAAGASPAAAASWPAAVLVSAAVPAAARLLVPAPAAVSPAAVSAVTAATAATAAAAGRRPRWPYRTPRGAAARAAAVLVVGAAAALAVGAAAAASPGGPALRSQAAKPPLTWHVVKKVGQGANSGVTAVTPVGASGGGWAFSGDGSAAPTAFRSTGSAWSPAPFPGRPGERVLAAQTTAAVDVWAFTTNGTTSRALRWNGSRWSVAGSFPREISGATVVSNSDVWVFGDQFQPGGVLGTWHFNGRAWTHVPGEAGLHGGSALSGRSIWAFGGTKVAHWNGRAWTATSVASLLPARDQNGLNDPGLTAIYAQSPTSVWAVGTGAREDEGGPLVVLHFNGRAWSRAALSGAFPGDPAFGQVAPDGRGGLWIPMPGNEGGRGHLVHYAGGHLTAAVLPIAANQIAPAVVAAIPASWQAMAGGLVHAPGSFGAGDASVILHFER